MENFFEQKKGITLIALVITIIVLLILAGISISMLSGDNGILQRATDAKERTSIAQEEESAKLTFTEVQMELSQGKTVDTTSFQKMIDGNFGTGIANGIIAGTTYIIKVQSARTYAMSSNGNIATLDKYPIDDNPGVLEQSGDIYTINCIEDLVAFSYNVNSGTESYEGKTVTLGRNLDFEDDVSYVDASSKYKKEDNGYTPDSESETSIKQFMTNTDGNGFIPIGGYGDGNTFKGTFDGKNKTISNLYIKSNKWSGLFGRIVTETQICNISLDLSKITIYGGTAIAGGIVGLCNANLTIENCHNNGTINGASNVGGIIGVCTSNLKAVNCSNKGEIFSGVGTTAGIVGMAMQGSVYNCFNTADINGTSHSVFGIAFFNSNGTVMNCYNTGNLTTSSAISGIAKANTIINCYNNGKVTAAGSAGGIVTDTVDATVANCYNFNSVTGNMNVGGIVGSGSATIKDCYNAGTIETKSSNNVGGIGGTGSTVTNSHNVGTVIGNAPEKAGEITTASASGSVDNTNDYLIKTDELGNSLNANANGATGKEKSEMDEIMSVQNFVNVMNTYVAENNADSSKTKLKTWKVENGFPVFAE